MKAFLVLLMLLVPALVMAHPDEEVVTQTVSIGPMTTDSRSFSMATFLQNAWINEDGDTVNFPFEAVEDIRSTTYLFVTDEVNMQPGAQGGFGPLL